MSVAIIAASLPTIRPLFMGKSPESMIGSFRSIFSLRSRASTRNAGYEEHSLENDEGVYRLSSAKGSKNPSISTGETRNKFEADGR